VTVWGVEEAACLGWSQGGDPPKNLAETNKTTVKNVGGRGSAKKKQKIFGENSLGGNQGCGTKRRNRGQKRRSSM